MSSIRTSIITIACFVLASTACTKDKYAGYQGESLIQFGPDSTQMNNNANLLQDTVKVYTFVYQPSEVVQDTVYFDIYAIGGISQQDRYFMLEQENIPGANNAVPGTHYVPFNSSQLKEYYKIAAGRMHAKIPVVILRDASLKSGTVQLKFRISEGGSFKLGMESNLWRRLEFGDNIIMPTLWATNNYGKYSRVKHEFMIQYTGEKWDDDFISEVAKEAALLAFWKGRLKTLLINYNQANPNNPLRDEDGELVIFP